MGVSVQVIKQKYLEFRYFWLKNIYMYDYSYLIQKTEIFRFYCKLICLLESKRRVELILKPRPSVSYGQVLGITDANCNQVPNVKRRYGLYNFFTYTCDQVYASKFINNCLCYIL